LINYFWGKLKGTKPATKILGFLRDKLGIDLNDDSGFSYNHYNYNGSN